MNENRVIFFLIYLGLPIGYVLLRCLPYLLFYILPLVVVAISIAAFWVWGCHLAGEEGRTLAVLFPLTILFLVLTVGFPSKPTKPVIPGVALIESPYLHGLFNGLKITIESVINWTWLSNFRWMFPFLLPSEKYVPFLYDLRDLSWTLWLAVCVGAPGLFLFCETGKARARISKLTADYEDKLRQADNKTFNLKKELDHDRNWTENALREKQEEIEKLKAVVQFMKKDSTSDSSGGENGSSSGSGAFDSDVL